MLQLGYSISSAVNWLVNILLNQVGPIGIANSGWRFYFLFVATNVVSAGVIFMWYPESSGIPLEKIDKVGISLGG